MDELLRDGNTYDPDGRQRPWCNFKEGGWLLNGAFTALDQKQLPPTRLSLPRVITLVQEALMYIDRLDRADRAKKKTTKATPTTVPTFTNSPHAKV